MRKRTKRWMARGHLDEMSQIALLFAFLLTSRVRLSSCQLQYKCDSIREKENVIGYIKREKVYINVEPLSTKRVTSATQCLHTCSMDCECASVNIKKNDPESRTMICEVLDTSLVNQTAPVQFSDNYGKTYHPKCGACRSFTTSAGDACDCTTVVLPETDCDTHNKRGRTQSGLYYINPLSDMPKFPIFCEMTKRGWTVFQRRVDGSVNFNRTWREYKEGFGHLATEFWLGNELLHKMTSKRKYRMKAFIMAPAVDRDYAEYTNFKLMPEASDYAFSGSFSGSKDWVGDSLMYAEAFNTWDTLGSSRTEFQYGGWWFSNELSALDSNFNGQYYLNKSCPGSNGITWTTWDLYCGICPTHVYMAMRV